MNNTEYLIIIIFVISVVIYFLMREVNAWYWKINDIIRILNSQNLLLEKILNKPSVEFTGENAWICPECKSKNPNSTFECSNCHYSLK